jgi:pimeloyl-ACP methyl ester carboxylesterase
MADSLIKLSSGRMLGFAEYGDPKGAPMFYFHGWPSSRLQGELMDETGKKLSLRIIAPDRPGIATSQFHPGRTLGDWPPLLMDLAAHLGVEKFHVLGVSGGGPYALVTAYAMPDRLLSAGVVCGAPPLREVGTEGLFWLYKVAMWAQRRLPFTVPPGLRIGGWIAGRRSNQWPQSWLSRFYAEADRSALQDPRLYRIMMESSRAALLADANAVRWDGNLYTADWGFNLADIRFPVRFWHGDDDWNIPIALAEKAAARIPGARFKVCPRDGHFSLPLLRSEEIASELLYGSTAEMLK